MLLHALAILLFGAPSGGSREGRAMWGPLNVVLQPRPEPVAAPPLKIERKLAIPKTASPPPSRLDPAVTQEIERTARPVIPDAPKRPRLADPAPQSEAPLVFPPLLDRLVTPRPKEELLPPLQVPLPTQAEPAAAPATPSAPHPAPIEAVRIEAAPLEPVVAPPVQRMLAEPPPLPAPLLQPLAPPEPERRTTPPVERAPLETTAVPVTPATPPIERPPVEVQAVPVPPTQQPPVEVQPIPMPPIESIAPPRAEPAPKPVEQPAAQEISAPRAPAATERSQPRAPEPARSEPRRIERELAPSPSPLRTPAPTPGPSPRLAPKPEGDPDYDPTAGPPRLDLDALRRRAGEVAREGTGNRALLPFPMPPVPKPKSKLETAIENARKPDCRDAYKGLGLAAVVPLIANEFGEGTCRW